MVELSKLGYDSSTQTNRMNYNKSLASMKQRAYDCCDIADAI